MRRNADGKKRDPRVANPPRILLVTGLSGSGKSTAIRALEDAGFFCIDNLPVPLLGKLVELAKQAGDMPRIAVVVDAREGRFLGDLPQAISNLRERARVEVLYLDASDEVLIRRYSETRRRHPLSPDGSVVGGIAEERKVLRTLRDLADEAIDTSSLTVHELKKLIQARFGPESSEPSVALISFGFRHGLPLQADLVFDVRFLPNPYFVPDMRARTGREEDVAAYVLDRSEAQEFLRYTTEMIAFLLPHYRREGKSYLTIAIGCTGGKHRSVAVVRELARRLEGEGVLLHVWDRDIERE
ncbi:MAG TPA: RNase adapter RapZ [Fredinandcohnia sp.]|nr:RNase adapter RapZ [Fredinandcohnia sp.]